MVIDDLANRIHHCDILLDQTFGRTQKDYHPFTPKGCTLLLGKEFMLLRDEFFNSRVLAQEHRNNQQLKSPNNVLISLGGTDPENIAKQIVSWLISMKDNFMELAVCLVANADSSFLDELYSLARPHQWIEILIRPPSMSKLMLNADIAIGSSGATAWERCCLGLPALSIISADNQQLVSKNLTDAGAVISLGCFKELKEQNFREAFSLLFNNKSLYQKMIHQSFDCCDGLGAGKVAKWVLQTISSLELAPATTKDKETTFKWQSDKGIRHFFKQPTTPTRTQHYQWFDTNLADPSSSLYIINYNNAPVGTIRLDEIKHSEYEISILIAPNYQDKGIALNALKKASQLKENGLFFADIHKDNINSIKLFKKAGFIAISPSRYCLKIDSPKQL
jgi:spore coat polysaccharide biosynthesis predicted glycosyltransferase SpsG/RimJ/RimL family protein N-acetyltransferase